MAENIIQNLCDTVTERRENPSEGSYTGYLFEQGLDKVFEKMRRGMLGGHHCGQKRRPAGS